MAMLPGLVKPSAISPFADVDEIVEGVGALLELALQEPVVAEVVAAADVGDGVGPAAVEQADPAGRRSSAGSP